MKQVPCRGLTSPTDPGTRRLCTVVTSATATASTRGKCLGNLLSLLRGTAGGPSAGAGS